MKERDTLEGIKNRYRRQIEELRLKRNEIDLELANLENYASTLQEIQARENGSDVPENVARIGGTLSLVKSVTPGRQIRWGRSGSLVSKSRISLKALSVQSDFSDYEGSCEGEQTSLPSWFQLPENAVAERSTIRAK
jgi:hypothetical protein